MYSLLQAACLQTEGVAVSSVLPSPLVGGSVVVCPATSSNKMASAALPPVSHTMAKQSAEADKPTQINTLHLSNLAVYLTVNHKHIL